MKDVFKNFKNYALLLVFAAFILVFAIADPLIPFRERSEMENRKLAQRPEFTLSSFFEGKWTANYEKYVNDQFIGRDLWITGKSLLETALLKTENNGITYGEDGYMFEKYTSFNEERFIRNLGVVAQFSEKYGKPVNFMLIPNSYQILSTKMPAGLKNIDESAYINSAYEQLSSESNIIMTDLLSPLSAASDSYIFYRTDHHWTNLGAWIGYTEFCRNNALKPIELESFEKHEVPDFYGTYYSKAKSWNAVPDTITWYDIPVKKLTADGVEHVNLNEVEKFSQRDKYGALVWGNHSLTVIESALRPHSAAEAVAPSRILVIKDSYSHSMAGFLTANYDEVWLLDLRYYQQSVSKLIAEQNFDSVLIMYNFMNFAGDVEVARLAN